MKKTLLAVLAVALILSVGTTEAFASCSRSGRRNTKSCYGSSYGHHSSVCSHVDADCNGVCDSCGRYCTVKTKLDCCFVDADANGVCDVCGKYYSSAKAQHGCRFADTNGDGICDVCGSHHGTAETKHDCCFVDADCNGICDVCGKYFAADGTQHGCNFTDADGDGICDVCGRYHGTWNGSGDYTNGCHGGYGHGRHHGGYCW